MAEAETEADLLELAEGATTAQLERMVRAWKRGTRKDEAAWERARHRSRNLSVFPDDDGMYGVRGRLTPEVGALLMRAVEAAGDALFRKQRRAPVSASGRGEDTERTAARRRADALGLLAERALAAGFGSPASGDAANEAEEEAPISGTRAARYQVVLHVEPETLAAESDAEPGRSELEDGTRVSAETSRRLSCDAALVRVGHGPGGSILDVGRKRRTIPPALRRALEVRDRGCRFPGCGLRFTDAHHLRHWAHGGQTRLDNTLLLCRHHHRLVHEGGWRVEWWGKGRAAFRDPKGQVHIDGGWQPPEPLPRQPVKALARLNRRRGAQPHPYTASARWKREWDIPNEIRFRASEAGL